MNLIIKNSSGSSIREGNTIPPKKKQISPSIRWVMTLNNYTEDELIQISSIVPKYCKYAIIGKEVGEEGTPHLQGYIEFKHKSRPNSVFSFTKRIHWEKARGKREDNDIYCNKEERWLEFPKAEEFDVIGYDELWAWQKSMLDIFKAKPDKRTIHWFWGEGNMGKTEMIRYLHHHYKVPFSYGGSVSDIMNLAFNNMKDANAFLFSLTRVKGNKISYDALEQLKDGCISNNKYETGCFVMPKRPHVFVFANFPPECDEDEMFMSRDKIKVIEVSRAEGE